MLRSNQLEKSKARDDIVLGGVECLANSSSEKVKILLFYLENRLSLVERIELCEIKNINEYLYLKIFMNTLFNSILRAS